MPIGLQITLYRRTWYFRRSGFRVESESPTRIVLRGRNLGLLSGGLVFAAGGAALVGLTLAEGWHRTEGAAGWALIGFAVLVAAFGGLIIWASRTQRDRIVADREEGSLRIEKARKRKRPGQPLFRVVRRRLDEVSRLELRPCEPPPGSMELRVVFHDGSSVRLDRATDARHLADLGDRLAAAAGLSPLDRDR